MANHSWKYGDLQGNDGGIPVAVVTGIKYANSGKPSKIMLWLFLGGSGKQGFFRTAVKDSVSIAHFVEEICKIYFNTIKCQ